MGRELTPSWVTQRITRRQALRGAIAGGVAIGAGGLLAACSGGETDGTNTATTSQNGAPRGGSLRVGVTGGGAEDTIDAHNPTSDPDIARVHQLYEPLANRDQDYVLQMVLAESIEAETSADNWTIRLKPDITFHNGQPVTADDVIFSINRILDPDNPQVGAASLGQIDPKQLRKLDDRTVRVKLTAQNAGFPDDIGQYFNGIVPVDYDPKDPLGTGPFKYQSFTAGTESVFVRNDDYWGEVGLDEITLIDFADDAARVNALLSGEVEAISNLPPGQIDAVSVNQDMQLLIAETGAWQPFTMRVDAAPFNDVRVRQAMRLIVDREQMIQQALNGEGRVANDLYSPFDPCFADDLAQREQNLDEARSLLKSAGQEGLTVELVTSPVFAGIVEAAQVFAEQAKGAGVTVKVRKVDSGTFYGDNYLQWPFAQDFWFTRTYLAQVAQSSLPNSPFNETHWSDEKFQSLIAEAQRTVDDAQRCDILHEAQQMEYDQGGYIVWSFSNQLDAHSNTISGLTPSRSGVPLGSFDFRKVAFVG